MVMAQSPKADSADAPALPSIAGFRKLLVCGPVAEAGKPARGGFESANLRVMTLARRLCAETGALRYPEVEGGAVAKAVAYVAAFLRIGFAILLGKAQGAAIHDGLQHIADWLQHWSDATTATATALGASAIAYGWTDGYNAEQISNADK